METRGSISKYFKLFEYHYRQNALNRSRRAQESQLAEEAQALSLQDGDDDTSNGVEDIHTIEETHEHPELDDDVENVLDDDEVLSQEYV